MENGTDVQVLKAANVQLIIDANADQGYRTLVQAASRKIDSLDNEMSVHYLQDVYDDYVIYESRLRNGGSKFYKQTYQMKDDGTLDLTGNAQQVTQKITYEPVPMTQRTKFNNNSKNTEVKMDNNKPPCGQCMEKIVALINNKATKFTEADREWLLTQEESVLDKLMPVTEEVKPVVNAEPKKLTSEEVINALSAEDKAAFEFGKRQLRERRNTMIQGIQANTSKEIWPDAVLANTDDALLERIYNSVKKEPVVDYSLSGFGGHPVEANSSMPAIEIPVGV